ncbi:MAG: DUF4363 family protein [Oscillospiraceae bacterium]|nr:DUF4363 family protein [Oscillospiraceae bacterium]
MDRKIGPVGFREVLGIGLLTGFLLMGLLSAWYLNRRQDVIAAQLEDSVWLALSGQWEKACQGVENARTGWESDRALWGIFGDQTPMEEIDALFAQLTVYAAAREPTDFASGCAALAQHLNAMGNAHRLSIQNVL